MIAGHMITVVIGRRPKTYVVYEAAADAAVARLRRQIGPSCDAPISTLAVSATVMAAHGLAPGQVKLLHL